MKTAHVVRLTRYFDYPAARVFDAWLDPALARRFLFATEDGEMVRVEMDARVGGRFLITERREGGEVEHLGEYLEIDRPRRLVFTLRVPQCSPGPDRITVEIRPVGPGCELTLTHALEAAADGQAARLESGWNSILGALAQTVTPGTPPNVAPDYVTVPERATVRFERLLPGPVERVWSYLTEPEKRATWFAGGPTELRVGGAMELHVDHRNITGEPAPEEHQNKCQGDIHHQARVTRCEPPRVFSFTWLEGAEGPSETTFELTPRGEDVLLVLTHRRLPNRDTMLGVAGGWQSHVLILEDRLRGREPRPFWSTHAQLRAEYEKRLTPDDFPPEG